MQHMQKTQVRSLGQENPVEEEMATHSSIFQGQRILVGYHPWDCKEQDVTEHSTARHGTYKLTGQNWGSGIPQNWASILSLPLTSSAVLDS